LEYVELFDEPISGVPTLRSDAGGEGRWEIWAIVAILAATLPWWVATTCPFIYFDDPAYISGNRHVLGGLTGEEVGWAFGSTSFGFWFPLTWLSLMGDATVFGSGAFGFHFTNVVLHILNAWLVYFVLRRMTGMRGRSLVVALLFAVHPLRVESVAWATERKDVLTVLFGLLTMWGYVEYAQRGRMGWYLLMIVFYGMTLLSKSMLVTLPFLFLLLDFWPLGRLQGVGRGRGLRMIILEKLPLLAMAAAISVVTYWIQVGTNAKAYEAVKPASLRLENAAVSYVLYLRDTFYFGGLSIYYNYERSIPAWEWGGAAVLLLGITVAVVVAAWKRESWRGVAVGWLWFVGTLVPVIGIVQSGNQSRADRFTYFPSIGLFIALVWLWPEEWLMRGWRRKLSVGLAWAVIAVLMLCMTFQLVLWRDPLRLYLLGLSHTRDNWFLESIAAYEYQVRGENEEAIKYYEDVVRLAPNMHEPENNLGGLLAKAGRLEEAVVHLRRAHELAPDNAVYEENYRKVSAYLRSRGGTSASQPSISR